METSIGVRKQFDSDNNAGALGVRPVAHSDAVLTQEALGFLTGLIRSFGPRVQELLKARQRRHAASAAGALPDFLMESTDLRESDWRAAPLPDDLRDRRVEITGPVDRKMIINALNSGARVFMADFEDSTSPTWSNIIGGQKNLADAVRRTIDFTAANGKHYQLNEETAVLMVRPRGWHLLEKHFVLDGGPVPAALVDFGLFFFHNAAELIQRGSAPYFYLPKLESHREARLWNDVFVYAQQTLHIPVGTIRATVLIETLPAAFEMDEIIFELRDHIAGLNCGRWDYIFSFIKTLGEHDNFVLPDRAQVTMDRAFLRAYSRLLIRTCHRRGIHAMGGMAAQIPIKGSRAENDAAIEKVRVDKLREVKDGHDGTWVAHPGLVATALEVFDSHMSGPNQIGRAVDSTNIGRADLLEVHQGSKTLGGMHLNVRVGIQYLESWLRGQGCVPLYNLMEDAATAEISRAQVWQWLRHRVVLDDGQKVTVALLDQVIEEELRRIRDEIGHDVFDDGKFSEASDIFRRLSTQTPFVEFLTLPAYDVLITEENQ